MLDRIKSEIDGLVRESPFNRLPDSSRPFFDAPLIGIASAEDPLFLEFKQAVGAFHKTPAEILAGARSVIVWVLPITRDVRSSNAGEKQYPSREWAQTRDKGEIFNSLLRRHLVDLLQRHGHTAVAPQLAGNWRQVEDARVGLASTWSERHAAYAAGLGTFSLNDAVITQRGIAHRLGSVITDANLPTTRRTAPDHRHNCLWHRNGTCGACIARCPVGALSKDGHNKAACRDYVYSIIPQAVGHHFGVTQTGCGLCQTGVPCEASIPGGDHLCSAP